MKVQGRRKRGRPKRRWLDKVKDDIKEKGLSADDVYDRATWRRMSPDNYFCFRNKSNSCGNIRICYKYNQSNIGVGAQTCRLPSKLPLGIEPTGRLYLALGSRPVGSPAYISALGSRQVGSPRKLPALGARHVGSLGLDTAQLLN